MRFLILLVALCPVFIPNTPALQAQSVPTSFPYQGIVRDGDEVVMGLVSLQFALRKGAPDGPIQYEEAQVTMTNQEGIFSVLIGKENPAAFAAIDWSQGPYFLQVQVDKEGGSNYTYLGATQILSVPYALFAAKAETALDDQDRDPANELQTLQLDGQELTLSPAGGSVTLPESLVYQAGAGIAIENQIITNTAPAVNPELSLNGQILSVSPGGSTVTLPIAGGSNWTLSGNNIARTIGNVGIGLAAQSEYQLTVKETQALFNEQNQLRIRWSISGTDEGRIETYSTNNLPIVRLSASGQQSGRIDLFSNNGNIRQTHALNSGGAGYSEYFGPNSSTNIRVSSQESNYGILTLHNQEGNIRGLFSAYTPTSFNGMGYLATFGPNGNVNTILTSYQNLDNNGGLGVFNNAGNERAAMYVDGSGNGVITANIKNFRMPHPEDPDTHIWYASLEGPEAAAYERGTASLRDGEAFIPFSDHFHLVINPSTMTVHLTPQSAESFGLAVVEKSARGFRVKELMKGTGNYTFDWEVKGVRKGFEDYRPIRPAAEGNLYHAPLPEQPTPN